jgi:hypothetical protein
MSTSVFSIGIYSIWSNFLLFVLSTMNFLPAAISVRWAEAFPDCLISSIVNDLSLTGAVGNYFFSCLKIWLRLKL